MKPLSKESTEAMNRAQAEVNEEILKGLAHKSELVFNPETLTHQQREEIILAKYREDIYLTSTIEGNWKIWKRIFN